MTTSSTAKHRGAAPSSQDSVQPPDWFVPLLFLALPIIAFFNVAVLGSIYLIYRSFRIYQEANREGNERRLRTRLRQHGRFLSVNELEAKLRAGEGTLIVQQNQGNYPDGLLWWTSDDVFRSSPVPLPGGHRQLEEDTLTGKKKQPYEQYLKQFVTSYIDEKQGCAWLTTFPKQLVDKFPKPKVVLLEQVLEGTALFHGDEYSLRAAILNSEDVSNRPGYTKVEVERGSDGLRMVVPALGIGQFKREVVHCVLGFLAGLFVAAGFGIAAAWFLPFSVVALVGVLAVGLQTVNLLQIITMACRRAKIEITRDALRLKECGMFPAGWQEWKRCSIVIIGVCDEGSGANGRSLTDLIFGLDDLRSVDFFRARRQELQIRFHDGRTIGFLAGRVPEELQWIGTLLREQLLHC
jgi:hypothetical protein